MAKSKQTIKWTWESEILEALNRYVDHKCISPNYGLHSVELLSSKTENLNVGLSNRLNPKISRYVAVLICNKCYDAYKVIYGYGYNSKIDHFDVISVEKE